jgi:transducin (beta)-like 1
MVLFVILTPGPTLDVSWRDNVTFATCSADKQIYINQMGSFEPLQQFSGHEEEVNSVRWDPTGTMLASSSDDFTAKIWRIGQDEAVFTLKGHSKEVYIVRWAPDTSSFPMLATY